MVPETISLAIKTDVQRSQGEYRSYEFMEIFLSEIFLSEIFLSEIWVDGRRFSILFFS
jgi:hypothetical protein